MNELSKRNDIGKNRGLHVRKAKRLGYPTRNSIDRVSLGPLTQGRREFGILRRGRLKKVEDAPRLYLRVKTLVAYYKLSVFPMGTMPDADHRLPTSKLRVTTSPDVHTP